MAILVVAVAILLIGPVGLIVGPIVYSLFFTGTHKKGYGPRTYRQSTQSRTPQIPILVLLAAVMKADGRIMRSELDYVRNFLLRYLPEDQVRIALIELRDMLKGPLPLSEACLQIRVTKSYAEREMIMKVLFELAQADGNMHPLERALLGRIANALGVTDRDYTQMYNTYHEQEVDYYAVLGLESSASNEEVRKAYRTMAMQWHPDRFSRQGDEAIEKANEKLKSINEAYEHIKQQRGMK